MTDTWDPDAPGVLKLPSGRLVRGRGLRYPLPPGPTPAYAVYVLGKPPSGIEWRHRWIRWPDMWLPANRDELAQAVRELWERSADERVEIACNAGKGRTGTTLACLAVLDGVPNDQAVSYVREHYHRHAVETPWQRRLVNRFAAR